MGQLLFGFNGRIRRTNYWLGNFGASFVVSILFAILFFVLGGAGALAAGAMNGDASQGPSDASTMATSGAGLVLVLLIFVYVLLMTWIRLALVVKI
jgi:uncharacterized membrane protein YhaH (DUF805 family)